MLELEQGLELFRRDSALESDMRIEINAELAPVDPRHQNLDQGSQSGFDARASAVERPVHCGHRGIRPRYTPPEAHRFQLAAVAATLQHENHPHVPWIGKSFRGIDVAHLVLRAGRATGSVRSLLYCMRARRQFERDARIS